MVKLPHGIGVNNKMFTSKFLSYFKELQQEIKQNGLSLFEYMGEINQELENNREIIKQLDFTIVQMKKELVEREISQKRYLAKIKTLEKKEKLEQNLKKLVEDF